MIIYCQSNLKEIKKLLEQIDKLSYTQPLTFLSGSSIGQHVRHILEFYQCLLLAKESAIVNYDNRLRNLKIETDVFFAQEIIQDLLKDLKLICVNDSLFLEGNFSHLENGSNKIPTSYQRELAYCLEHSIHHQALIKVGLKELDIENIIDKNFGVAPATIRYKQQCAQ